MRGFALLAVTSLAVIVINLLIVYSAGWGQEKAPGQLAAPPPWPPVRTDPDAAGVYDPVLFPVRKVPDGKTIPTDITPPSPWCKSVPGEPGWYCNGLPDPPSVEERRSVEDEAQRQRENARSDVFMRHYVDLAGIQGFAGGGVGDGVITIYVDEPHGQFPIDLDGVPTRLVPKIRAWSLGDPLMWKK